MSSASMRGSQRQQPAARRRGVFGTSWITAWWTAPDGHKRAGSIPVVPAWPRAVRRSWGGDASGAPTGPPPRYGVPVAGEALVAVLATAAQGAVLW